MLNMISCFKGTLRIKILGASPERFINLCSKNDILLWNIVQVYDVYYMNISLKNFYTIKPLLRKTGTRVIILKRYGLPFFMYRLNKRKIFVISLLFCICFWMITTQFIREIQIQGNSRISEDMLLKALKTQDICIGTFMPVTDLLEASAAMREYFDDIAWIGMGYDGTVLKIQIKEKNAGYFMDNIIVQDYKNKAIAAQDEISAACDCDIVAENDGTIVSIVVRAGIPLVKKGDFVTAGQVLVEGAVPISNDDGTIREYMNVISDADILLEYEKDKEFLLPFCYIRKEYTGRNKDNKYLIFNENRISLPMESPYLKWDEVSSEKVFSLKRPVDIKIGLGKNIYREYQDKEYKYTPYQAKYLLENNLNEFIQTLEEKGVQIIEKNGTIETDDKQWIYNVNLRVREYVKGYGDK